MTVFEARQDDLLDALRRAVDGRPDDVLLRLHLADLLLRAGQDDDAVAQCALVLRTAPTEPLAKTLMSRALGVEPIVRSTEVPGDVVTDRGADGGPVSHREPDGTAQADAVEDAGAGSEVPRSEPGDVPGFDWRSAESDVADVAPSPMFVDGGAADVTAPGASAWDVARSEVTLADVGGMAEVKERLEAAFIAPLRNPELRRLYGKSLRGGMLLYGPPGCGKTFLGRAVAGEMGAQFMNVGLSDVLDMYIGQSESNIHEMFELARRSAPVVVFLDEVDALGQKRSMSHNSAMRGAVNQLLVELDGVTGVNEGVFVIAATNQPWDVDPALRRPGRLDRTLLVLPPDRKAREQVFRFHLASRPVGGVDLGRLADRSEGLSGADIAHVCETASEKALLEGIRTGQVRLIDMNDLLAALSEVRPSTGSWFESAKNVVEFANQDGAYDELAKHLRKRRRW